MHRVSGPGGMGAGLAIKVPLQRVNRERWQGDSGGTCLGGVMCLGALKGWGWEMPGLQARSPRAGSASGFGWGRDSAWRLSIPGQCPRGTAQAPPCPAPALEEPNSPKSFHKHPAMPAPHHRQVPALAPPSSGGLRTVKGGGDAAVPISQPPPPSCPVGICPIPAPATGTWLPGAFADPLTSPLPTQAQSRAGGSVGRRLPSPPLGERAPLASLGTFLGH